MRVLFAELCFKLRMINNVLFLLPCIKAEDIDDKDNDVHYYRKDGTHAYERINGREDIQQYKQTDGKHNDILDYPVFVKNKSKHRYPRQNAESKGKQPLRKVSVSDIAEPKASPTEPPSIICKAFCETNTEAHSDF